MRARQKVTCPACGKFFFEAWWVGQHLSISILTSCRCKRLIEIREDYTARIVTDAAMNLMESNQ